ncbi:MAG: PH domain-containing protein [Clostridia bacterium]|nr:PH domain-containing protein [Clostridia bacterium]
MKPNLVVKKSAWSAVTPLCVIFFWLVIPLIVMICRIIVAKHYVFEFYDEHVIVKSGVLSRNERKTVFPTILSVSVSQSFWGRIVGYGNVMVDVVGKWDVRLEQIGAPYLVKQYFEGRIGNASGIQTIVTE